MLAAAGKEAEEMAGTRPRTLSERVKERFQATLAGLLELEVLRARHKQMVEMALGDGSSSRAKRDTQLGNDQYWLEGNSSRLRLTRSLSEDDLERRRMVQSWSRHPSEDLLLDSTGHCDEGLVPRAQAVWDDSSSSRASSGFCEDDMSEMCSDDADVSFLSNSFVSLSTQNATEAGGTPRSCPPIMMKRSEGQSEAREDSPADLGQAIPQDSFFSVASLYPDSHWPDVSEILQPQVVLEPRYRSDLRSLQGPEVYRYPSPLHAVALQSPLYAPRSPIHHNRSWLHSTVKPGLRPVSVYLSPQSDFLGVNSECSYLPNSVCVPTPGHTCQTLPHVSCEKQRLEALISRLAQCYQHFRSQPSLPGPPKGKPVSSLRRTCSMGKGKFSDNKRKKRGDRTEMQDYTSVSFPRTLKGLKRAMCVSRSHGVTKNRGDTDTAVLLFPSDEECVSVSGSKKSREAHDVAKQREQPSPQMVIFSPGCMRRRSTV